MISEYDLILVDRLATSIENSIEENRSETMEELNRRRDHELTAEALRDLVAMARRRA